MANYTHLTATYQVKVGAGKLKSIFVSSGTSPTVAVYDTDAGSTSGTTLIATFTPTTPGIYIFTGGDDGLFFNKGLYVVLGGTTPKVTIAYA
jgi:hypothetical protein